MACVTELAAAAGAWLVLLSLQQQGHGLLAVAGVASGCCSLAAAVAVTVAAAGTAAVAAAVTAAVGAAAAGIGLGVLYLAVRQGFGETPHSLIHHTVLWRLCSAHPAVGGGVPYACITASGCWHVEEDMHNRNLGCGRNPVRTVVSDAVCTHCADQV
jgi:hypothetical protein